jgi:galactose-1-phosphate uridylyltransferase
MQQQEDWRRLLLRTEETAKKYEEAQRNQGTSGCRLCNDLTTLTEFNYWRLVPNAFPYDRFFSQSVMLMPKRHTNESDLRSEELSEFREIKKSVLVEEYDLIFENLPKQKSIPHHLHYHIVKIKDERN